MLPAWAGYAVGLRRLITAVAVWRSLSEFVKCLKFRFTRWYNRRNGRKGVLWESRFTSVIVQSSEYSSCTVSALASAVEEEERALRTMAAYIDLNPVRAGMVSD